jgi:hypothetical protein
VVLRHTLYGYTVIINQKVEVGGAMSSGQWFTQAELDSLVDEFVSTY